MVLSPCLASFGLVRGAFSWFLLRPRVLACAVCPVGSSWFLCPRRPPASPAGVLGRGHGFRGSPCQSCVCVLADRAETGAMTLSLGALRLQNGTGPVNGSPR